MKKFLKDEEVKKKIYVYSISGIIIVGFALALFNFDSITSFIKDFIGILSPFIWGAFFAFIMSKFANWLENKLGDKISFKTKRAISTTVSILLLIASITLIFLIVMPQLADSVAKLSKIIVDFTSKSPAWKKDVNPNIQIPANITELLYKYSNTLISSIWSFITTSIPNVVNFTISTVNGILNFTIGIIIAIYFLIDREKILEAFRRFFKAFLSDKLYTKVTIIYNVSISRFYKFFEGKLLDSLIVGVICFIGMTILRLDFSILISFIVCVTNIIPFFGPFIGAIPSILILLMVDPMQALVFAIFVLVLQQIDGNIIGPKILGESVGLSSLWIIFAIIVGGAYFGFLGMILSVPIFSVIHFLIKEEVDKRLNKKKKAN